MVGKMKRRGVATIGLMVLGAFSFYACGGGGGGGGGSTASNNPTAVLDATMMDEAVGKVGNFIPGCEAVTVAKTTVSARQLPLATMKLVLSRFKAMAKTGGVSPMAATPINETVNGDCPGHGGNYTRVGTHNSGVTSVTITYNDYCEVDSDTGVETFQDGVMSYVDTGTPSDSGPIRTKVTAKTASSGVRIWTDDGLVDETITFSGMAYTIGTPGEEPTLADPNTLKFTSFKLEDSVADSTQKITNFQADLYFDGTDSLIDINSMTLTNSNGVVTIETTTPITENDDGYVIDGTIVVTGKTNTEAILEVKADEPGVFDVTVNGAPLVTDLNCTDSSL